MYTLRPSSAARTACQAHRMSTLGELFCWRYLSKLGTDVELEPAYNGPVDESKMAARKSDCLAGKRICASALPAPADWPQIVTFFGSPPNAAMFSCRNAKACRWSRKPAFKSSGGT